jgi:hypothetical protein
MNRGSREQFVGRAKVIRHAVSALLGLCIPCRHRRQSVAGRRLAAGVHEMFLVCSRCGKRVSPGVRLGPGTVAAERPAAATAADLTPANSLAK